MAGETVWATAGRNVLRRAGDGPWRRFCRFPFQLNRISCGIRPLARITRAVKCNVRENTSGKVIGLKGGVVHELLPDKVKAIAEIEGDSVLHACFCEDAEGWTYMGEYFRNQSRGPVRIHRFSPDLSTHEIAYEFPAGAVRHIHGIFQDPLHPGELWVTTGDNPGECYLFHTTDRFASLSRLGDGDQLWRAVKLHFTDTHISWLTDTNLRQNHACRIKRGSEELEVGGEIVGPVYYGCRTSDGLFVAFSSVEPGPGVLGNNSVVLTSRDAYQWHPVAKYQKDSWHMKLFGFGVICCPEGEMSSQQFMMSGEGLKKFDGETIVARIGVAG